VSVRATGGRTYTVQVTCRDRAGNASSAAAAVVVPPDTAPPVISSVTVTPSIIWPPNGHYWGIGVSVDASDNSGEVPACAVTAVTGNGGLKGDAVITGPLSLSVSAIKDQVYSVQVTCGDSAGNTAQGFANVYVLKDSAVGTAKAYGKVLLAQRGFVPGRR
jgi:hypothetical protein